MKVPFHLPPPKSWEDFEEMLWDLFRAEWNDPHTQKHGRRGQRQYGVDIFGQPGRKGEWTGVQAKEKDQFSASLLTEKELEAEVEKAKNFNPPLTDFIIATTAPRDKNIQRKARLLTQDHQKVGLFRVHVYSWEEIEKLLETHLHIRKQWYQEFLFDDQNSSAKLAEGTSDATIALALRSHSALLPPSSAPSQAQKIREEIWTNICSVYFPTDVSQAREYLEQGDLAHASPMLVREILLDLTQSLFCEPLPQGTRTSRLAALQAIGQIDPATSESFFNEDFPELVRRIEDAYWPHVIEYIRFISPAWSAVRKPERIKASLFLDLAPQAVVVPIIRHALHINALRECTLKRLPEFSLENLIEQIRVEPLEEYVALALPLFAKAKSFDEGNRLARSLILPLLPVLAASTLKQTLDIFMQNHQLHGSSGTIDIIAILFTQKQEYAQELRETWMGIYRDVHMEGWRRDGSTLKNGQLYPGHPLLNGIEDAFPEVLERVKQEQCFYYYNPFKKRFNV